MKDTKQLHQLFDALSNASSHYLFLVDEQTYETRLAPSAVDYFNIDSNILQKPVEQWIQYVHPNDIGIAKKLLAEISDCNIGHCKGSFRVKNKYGAYVNVVLNGSLIRDGERPLYYAGAVNNSDQNVTTHPTTNLNTAPILINDLKYLQTKKQPAFVLLTGITNFDEINHLYGYQFGNRLLKKIALDLSKIAENTLLFSTDSVRFTFLSTKNTEQDMIRIFNDFKHYLNHGLELDQIQVHLEIGGALSYYDLFTIEPEEFLTTTEYALQSSKEMHLGDLVVCCAQDFEDENIEIRKIHLMRDDLINDFKNFYLEYQPVVGSNDEKIKGAEALIRYHSDVLGYVPPNEFIPQFEHDPLFIQLSNWIVKTALTEIKPILEDHPDFLLNVNLSYMEIKRPEFKRTILKILEETQFPPQNLCFELTERCRLLDFDLLKEQLQFLNDLGIRIAIDDFGTGFNSLELLLHLPITTIKIDRSFIVNIETSKRQQSLIRHISSLSNDLEVSMTAEGIETPEMLDVLKQFPISSYQGFYYSKPRRIEDFVKLKNL